MTIRPASARAGDEPPVFRLTLVAWTVLTGALAAAMLAAKTGLAWMLGLLPVFVGLGLGAAAWLVRGDDATPFLLGSRGGPRGAR